MAFKLHYKGNSRIIMTMDPGVKNFAWCVTRNQKVIACGMLKKALVKVTTKNMEAFEQEMQSIMLKYKPDVILAERFMIRGFLTYYVELVGIMVGAIKSLPLPFAREYHFITAASWKLSIKKVLVLKDLYKKAKKEHKLEPHIIDTLCTNRYIFNGCKFNKEDKDWILANLPLCKIKMVTAK